MSATVYFGVLSVVGGVLAIGLNVSIIVANIQSLRRGSKLTPCDVIHVVMGLVNISLPGFLLGHFLGCWLSTFYLTISFYVSVIPLPFLMYYTFWLTAWLCAYYCASITTFGHGLFAWMKRCLTTSLTSLLVSSGLLSFAISIPNFWILYLKIDGQYSANGTLVLTRIEVASTSIVYMVAANLLGCCLPFTVIVISLITSVSSLLRHVSNIRQKNPESTRPKLQSHINAIRTMVLLLTLSGIYCTAETMLFNIESFDDMKIWVSWSLVLVFPTAEALITIQASLKLRKIFLGIFCPAKLVNNIKSLGTLNSTV